LSLNLVGYLLQDLVSCIVTEDYIDADISQAKTLPSYYYTDLKIFENIKSNFFKNWHFAAHSSELNNENILPLQRMGVLLNDQLMLTKTDTFNCLSNVCTHRGMLIVDKKCNNSKLQCPYHGRIFDLNGNFLNMPKFENVKNFPTEEDNLNQFTLENWKNLLFISKEINDFNDFIQILSQRIGWMDIENFEYDTSKDRSYVVNANWALYVDNYLEGFHIPYVHGDLNKIIEYDSYRTELFSNGVLQIGLAKPDQLCFNLPKESPDYGLDIAAYYFWVYPNMMFNFYPWGLSVNIVIPLDSTRTRILYRGYIGDFDLVSKGAGGDLDKVEKEDQEIVEAVQLGVHSESYNRGKYSPEKETGVHHFHYLLTNSLN